MGKSVTATLKDILKAEEKLLGQLRKTVTLLVQKQSKKTLTDISKLKANAIKAYKDVIKASAPAPARKKAAPKKKAAAKKAVKKAAPKKKAAAKKAVKKAAPKKKAAKKAAAAAGK